MARGPADGDQLRPRRIGRLERDPLGKAQAFERRCPAGDLGRQGQEQLIEQAGPEQLADQVRTAFAQDQPGAQ